MHEKNLSTLLGQINTELKEIEAACQSIQGASGDAGAFREKMEAWMNEAGENNGPGHSTEELCQLQKEAMAHWKQMEASLQELHGSTLDLKRSVQERTGFLKGYLEVGRQEARIGAEPGSGPVDSREPGSANRQQDGAAYAQVFMVNENQIKTLSTLDGLREYLNGLSGLHGIWLVGIAAGLLLNLALGLALLLRGAGAGTEPALPGDAGPAPAVSEVERSRPSDGETEILPASPADVAPPPGQPAPSASLLSPKSAEKLISARAGYALTYLKNKSFSRLGAKYFHPEKGVHFLPEGLSAEGHQFAANVVEKAASSTTAYHWGLSEASLISMDFQKYYGRYIFDVDYTKEREARYNELSFAGRYGLSADQLARRFPDCLFAEYHRSGRSLILVFEKWQQDGGWYLSAVIHNQ
ncbi:MAG: hypothetical protein KDD19_21930 [Phaeodactylibacter sp.]|nr:hypothetical protein [Phaeodactylibacter sp.]MCB9049104.1 hypothetical protein [Lewinellaceae bacterium]